MKEKDEGPARRAGRPPYEPTPKDREQAKTLAGMGLRVRDIALVLGLSLPTLRKYFAQELAVGGAVANANVAKSLYGQATDAKHPSVVAAIFWLKARAGWSDQGPRVGRGRAPAKLGKKEVAAAEAREAQKGTEWDEILPAGQEPRTLQ